MGRGWGWLQDGVQARWGQRLPIPHRNMALLQGLLVLSLSCLQGPGLVVSLGLGLGGAGRPVGTHRGLDRKGGLSQGRVWL